MRDAFLRWMSTPRWGFRRRNRARTVVREAIENGKLQYSKVTLASIAVADGSFGSLGGG
jgi:hypothetical protein